MKMPTMPTSRIEKKNLTKESARETIQDDFDFSFFYFEFFSGPVSDLFIK